jgi:hypothetical protein
VLGVLAATLCLGAAGGARATTGDDIDGDEWTVAAGDCDDLDDHVYPGAADEWYDGVDANCAGDDDFDRDLDGWDWPDDCADLTPDVHPEAEELTDDVDQDCDGFVDPKNAIVPRGSAACAESPTAAGPVPLALFLFVARRRWSR